MILSEKGAPLSVYLCFTKVDSCNASDVEENFNISCFVLKKKEVDFYLAESATVQTDGPHNEHCLELFGNLTANYSLSFNYTLNSQTKQIAS